MNLAYRVRPISDPARFGKTEPTNSPFRVTWSQALTLLEFELSMIDASDVVIEADVEERDLRIDGQIRANAKPKSARVALAFTTPDGALLFACDQYVKPYGYVKMESWQANVYAIAKTLESLRAVDRYGATSRKEQYAGYQQIAAGPVEHVPFSTVREAVEWLGKYVGSSSPDYRVLVRKALRKAHPDMGGSTESWNRVQDAAKVLGL